MAAVFALLKGAVRQHDSTWVQSGPAMSPFVTARTRFAGARVHFLPTASVVMVINREAGAARVRFLTPHRTVRSLENVEESARLSPNFVKCLLGEPRRFLGIELLAAAHPMLSPFAGCDSIDGAADLLEDLRAALTVTPDERDFLSFWRAHDAAEEPLPTSDRFVQRLCLRFAGQAPRAINMASQLARTLAEDNHRRLSNSLGAFADASHLARVCRAYTGQPPMAWRHLSQTFS